MLTASQCECSLSDVLFQVNTNGGKDSWTVLPTKKYIKWYVRMQKFSLSGDSDAFSYLSNSVSSSSGADWPPHHCTAEPSAYP